MGDELITTIKQSPYGDTGAVYKGTLGMFNHYRLQLISFRKQKKTDEERAHLEADIAGYEQVLDSGSEENARAFMKYKRLEDFSHRCANNLLLVQWLKDNGHWKQQTPGGLGE